MGTLSVSVCGSFRSPLMGNYVEKQQFWVVKDEERTKYRSDGIATSYSVVLEIISDKKKPSLGTFYWISALLSSFPVWGRKRAFWPRSVGWNDHKARTFETRHHCINCTWSHCRKGWSFYMSTLLVSVSRNFRSPFMGNDAKTRPIWGSWRQKDHEECIFWDCSLFNYCGLHNARNEQLFTWYNLLAQSVVISAPNASRWKPRFCRAFPVETTMTVDPSDNAPCATSVLDVIIEQGEHW